MSKCYKNEDGLPIGSDFVLFKENPLDLIDNTYIKEVWYQEPSIVYQEILDQYIGKQLFKGNL